MSNPTLLHHPLHLWSNDLAGSSSVLQSPIIPTNPASAQEPAAVGVKPIDQGPPHLSDQVHPQIGPCQGPPAGGPTVAVDAPISLSGSAHTLIASSASSLFPDLATFFFAILASSGSNWALPGAPCGRTSLGMRTHYFATRYNLHFAYII